MKRLSANLFNPWMMFVAGLAIGVLARLLDIHTEVLGRMFSRLTIWILMGCVIALYSSSALKAGINILVFSLGMLMTYYLVAELTDGVYGMAYVRGWTLFAFITPLMAFLVRYSVMAGKGPLLVRCCLITVSAGSSIFLSGGPEFYDLFINLALVWLLMKRADHYRKRLLKTQNEKMVI